MKKVFLSDEMLALPALTLAIRTLLAGGLAINAMPSAHAELPVPTAPVTLSDTPVDIASQGHAAAAVSGTAMTIDQSTDKASIDWQSFNISPDSSVRFNQPGSASVALNNIHQADPSRIMGSLTANGQVYLVNQNGFVFGQHSQTNVNSLVATTLGISETTFQNGLTKAFANDGSAALQGSGETYLKDNHGNWVLDQNGQKIKIQIFIDAGANIKTNAAGGRVIIAAPVINNAGTITTPDGQTILAAAKDKVYLQEAGSDSDIRGLLVEVGTGGEANNMGQVLAERGNASVMGFAVNQNGTVSATTSVNLNGSVRLLAREGIQDPTGTGGKLLPKATVRDVALDDGLGNKAAVHLGGGSITGVGLDADKTATAIDAQSQSRSEIEISGHDVYLHKQSTVQAKSGHIGITALDDLSDGAAKGDARVFLETGSVVDASGVKNVPVAVERNIVNVELRKNELRDAPLQRDGVLYGQTVSVDVRDANLVYDGTGKLLTASIPVADIKGAVDRIARNIDERSTSGGSITIKSSGDVISQTGSLVDFSGGSVAYQDGVVETTQLLANGHSYDIAQADPNRHYDGILGLVFSKHPDWGITESWAVPGLGGKHFESGYTEGKAGGSFSITSYGTLLDGTLNGVTIAGTRQRTTAERAAGSGFSLDLSNNNLLGKQDIVFNKSAQLVDIAWDGALPNKSDGPSEVAALNLAADSFKSAGISHVHIKTNGTVSLGKAARLALPVDGSLSLSASGFDIQGAITAPSGDVSLKPISIDNTLTPAAITLGDSASIDVSGLWVNDIADGGAGHSLGLIASDAGTVSLVSEQADLQLQQGSRIEANGGAHVDNKSQLTAGNGGTISLTAANHDGGGNPANLILNGKLEAWAINQGGTVKLSSNEVVIGSASDVPSHTDNKTLPLLLSPDFFRQGGFADYQLTSNLYGLTVADHAHIKLQQQNLVLDKSFASQASGTSLKPFSTIATLSDLERKPGHLTLSFSELLAQNRQESLRIGTGASIGTDAQGSVTLNSDTSVFVDGSISTPGGTIAININPPISDKGFFASQGIWLGADSRLKAQGVFKPGLNGFGLKTGEVLAGGTVALAANRGYIVSRKGSVIDVSGSSAVLDFQEADSTGLGLKTVSEAIASDGGTISLKAGEGILADGGFKAQSGGGNSAGGTLNIELNRALRNKPLLPVGGGLFPDDTNKAQPRIILINAGGQTAIPENLPQGGNVANKYAGQALFSDQQINQGGFASLMLKTDALGANGSYLGGIKFNGDVSLDAARQIVLDTPSLQTVDGKVNLHTAYAKLGSSQSRIDTDQGDGTFVTTLSAAAKTGSGQFAVYAKGIDLVGGLSFNGFGDAQLSSRGDVRTIGSQGSSDNKNFLGEFKLAGDLTITASQLYPVTLSDFQIQAGDKGNGTVKIANSGAAAGPVYSAGGKLAITAPNIIQAGTVKAPFGTIKLDASDSVALAAGSLTSVSGAGLTVLFGQGSGGLNWLYPLDSTGSSNIVIDSPPEKHIALNGKTIALDDGAKVDLSGGGDLYAYEFITGPGGSNDVLAANSSGYTQKFAIIPSLGPALTPYDPQEFPSAGLQVGDSVYLNAGADLAAGWYSLLPAHYALLPGAYLVTPTAGTRDILPSQSFTNLAGATIVAGRYGVAGTEIADARWQGFAVESGSMARARSQYTDYFANRFFTAKAAADGVVVSALPQDAGSLAISAQTGLSLGAELTAAPANNGRGGQVDISAEQLAIVGRRGQLATSPSGTVSLLAEDLDKLNAPSLLLGGVRSKTKTGQRLTVSAQNVTVAGDASLQGDELLLAANNQILIKSGAVLESKAKNTNAGVDLEISNQGKNNSDGALLRLASSAQISVNRNQTITGKTGTLTVESGAQLKSTHSMLLDSTKDTLFDGNIDMQGGSLALAASKISVGAAPVGTSGLVLSATQFTLDELQLTSSSDIDLYGGVAINAGLLDIRAAHLNGFNNSGATASLTADTIKLSNTTAKSASNGNGDGSLALTAKDIQLGSGNYAINGFAKVNFTATNAIKGLGQMLDKTTGQSALSAAGKLTVAGDLALNAGHFVGDAGASTAIDASGHQVQIAALGADNSAWTSGLGASWDITGDSIQSNGRFDLPSGLLQLTALHGDIGLEAGSRLDVSGRTIAFADLLKASAAGNVSLSATAGHITLAQDARINLAGASHDGQQASDAGSLAIHVADGQFNWLGSISALDKTAANPALAQGNFTLLANNFGSGGFSALNQQLAASGFSQSVQLEQRSGDVTIAASDTVHAQQFSLFADQGQVSIAGHINASGATAGEVSIYGHNGISLGATGSITATASASGNAGGKVSLDTVHRDDTGSGRLDLSQAGGKIAVSGGVNGTGGTVHLRTGRDDAAHTVNISAIRSQIIGADANRTAVEATRIYDGLTDIKTANINAWQKDTSAFMAAAPALANFSDAAIALLPGLEVRGAGPLNLANTWDFMAWRYADANGDKTLPGFLTLRAGGDLNINASLTDAFATAAIPGVSTVTLNNLLQAGQSWSYQLLANNNVNLAYADKSGSQVMVRTGTGDIGINAGGNINFVANAKNANDAAAVYTMGKPADYNLSQLLAGNVPGVPARLAGESNTDYLNRLDPQQLNALLRYGYLVETQVGRKFMVAEYPSQGGSINLRAGGDINGINTGQEISDWLDRSGVLDANHLPTAWGVNVTGTRPVAAGGARAKGKYYFNQNVGALGGGDVSAEAGGNIRNLSVMLPTTGKPFGKVSTLANQWLATSTVVNGGGDLRIRAGKDIVGGEYFVGRGTAKLQAGGSVAAAGNGLGAMLELADGRFDVQARQAVQIASVANPTVLQTASKFFTYTDNSGINLTATAGNITLQNDVDAIRLAKGQSLGTPTGFEYAVYPGSLTATALSGDIRLDNSMTLFPSANGNLQLLAERNINTDTDKLIAINLSDADRSLLPDANAPVEKIDAANGLIRTEDRLNAATPDTNLTHAAIPVHSNSGNKPRIIANLGDIAFNSSAQLSFYLPQAAEFIAGRDISNLSLFGQNLSVNDVTLVKAGRNINFDALIDGDGIIQANDKQIELGGPGQLQIQAGGNISLGGSKGINTIGNTKNSNLPTDGASINVLAGISDKVDYAGFITKYFSLSSDYLKNLGIVDDNGNNILANDTPEQKLAYLQQLPDQRKQAVLLGVLANEIKQASAAAAAAPQAGRKALYQQGFDAIAALFPGSAYKGDLSLVFSQIKTLAGGGINLAAPGGAVNVGLAGKVGGIAKGADELGIVVQQSGDINAISLGDFNVNQSRVFAMGGGDIAIWSSKGNIDAGKGAKSAISAPAPIISVDAKGNIATIFPPVVSGSGIQTINPQDKSKKQGNVYLAAPVGIIDAGEAGISGGKIVIAATAVVGASNISASGGSVGVPTSVATPVVPSGAASAAASAAKQATTGNEEDDKNTGTDNKKTTVSLLSADVVGYGDCSVADVREGKPGCGG